MLSIARNLAAISVLLMLTSCTAQPTAPVRVTATAGDDAAACIAQLGHPRMTVSGALDAANIRVVNWNIHKGRNAEWVNDLDEVGMQPDLLILHPAAPWSPCSGSAR